MVRNHPRPSGESPATARFSSFWTSRVKPALSARTPARLPISAISAPSTRALSRVRSPASSRIAWAYTRSASPGVVWPICAITSAATPRVRYMTDANVRRSDRSSRPSGSGDSSGCSSLAWPPLSPVTTLRRPFFAAKYGGVAIAVELVLRTRRPRRCVVCPGCAWVSTGHPEARRTQWPSQSQQAVTCQPAPTSARTAETRWMSSPLRACRRARSAARASGQHKAAATAPRIPTPRAEVPPPLGFPRNRPG